MAINNSHKPIGSNISRDQGKLAGNTYGERRQLGLTKPVDQNVARPKDFFSQRKDGGTVAEVFSSNTQYLGTKKVLPHKVLEAGKGTTAPRVTDDVRLAFLDKIISGSGDNRSPKVAATTRTK